MKGLSMVIVSILCVILIVMIWQIIILNKRSKFINTSQIDDSKYYELKYQLQYITAIFPIIIVILIYTGYDYITNFPKEISKEIQTQIQPKIDSLKTEMRSFDSLSILMKEKGLKINSGLNHSNDTLQQLSNQIKISKRDVQILQQQTSEINQKDILHQPIHIITGLKFDIRDYKKTIYKFDQYRSTSGEPLPYFKKAPILMPIVNGIIITPFNITNTQFSADYKPFVMQYGVIYGNDVNVREFGVIIIEQP